LEIVGIIVGIVAFVLVIAVHELGHLLSAQWFGVAIKSFAIGFGPEAKVLFYRNGIRYVLNWIPFGGYVEFYDRKEIANRKQISLDEIRPWQRLIVFASGPLINIVFGCIIASGMFYYYGDRVYDNGFVITEVYPNSPAENAKLLPGDTLLVIANQDVTPDIDISDIAIAHKGESMPVTFLRDGQTLTTNLTPGPWSYAGASATVGYGINGGQAYHREDVGVLQSIQRGVSYTQESVFSSFAMLIPRGGQDSGASGEFVGVVGIIRATSNTYQQYGFEGFLLVLLGINIGIAAFNFIPFPGLDGSHIFLTLYEMIVRRPFPQAIRDSLFNIGIILLLIFFFYVLIKDVWAWAFGS
jgi:regulator of sigma E protease